MPAAARETAREAMVVGAPADSRSARDDPRRTSGPSRTAPISTNLQGSVTQPSAVVHELLQSVESLQSSVHKPSSQLRMLQLAVEVHVMSQKPPGQVTLQSLSLSQFTVQLPAGHAKLHVAPSSHVKAHRSPSHD
jgi:Tfp pilus assembly protein FimV